MNQPETSFAQDAQPGTKIMNTHSPNKQPQNKQLLNKQRLYMVAITAALLSACSDDGKTVGQRLDDTINTAHAEAQAVADSTQQGLKQAGDKALETASKTGKAIDEAAGKTGKAIDDTLSKTGEAVSGAAKDACSKVKQTFSDDQDSRC